MNDLVEDEGRQGATERFGGDHPPGYRGAHSMIVFARLRRIRRRLASDAEPGPGRPRMGSGRRRQPADTVRFGDGTMTAPRQAVNTTNDLWTWPSRSRRRQASCARLVNPGESGACADDDFRSFLRGALTHRAR